MLEKTEGAIKNGQSRETGNIGYTRHRSKSNKTKNTTQKTKKMSNTDTHQKLGLNPDALEGQAVPVSYKIPAMLLMCVGHHYAQTNTNNVSTNYKCINLRIVILHIPFMKSFVTVV